MRHNRDRRSLNRTASHRKAMLSNMVTSLFRRERIKTTSAKAKEAKRVAERMITFAKRGDLSARRHVAKTVRDPEVLRKLFDEIGPRFAEREGGYTRVLKLGRRGGDNTDMSLLELLSEGEKKRGKKSKPRKKYNKVDIPEDPVEAKRKKDKKKAEGEKKAKEAAEKEKAEEAVEEVVEEAAQEEKPAKEKAAKGKKAKSGGAKKAKTEKKEAKKEEGKEAEKAAPEEPETEKTEEDKTAAVEDAEEKKAKKSDKEEPAADEKADEEDGEKKE